MSNMQPGRQLSLDYAKGIGILLLIIMHCCGNPSIYLPGVWISAFFMPLFYIICGIIIGKKHTVIIEKEKFGVYFIKRSKQILVPYFVFGLTLIAFYQGLNLIADKPMNLGHQLFALVSMQGIESMWFLTRYLIAEMFFRFVYIYLKWPMRMFMAIFSVAIITLIGNCGMPEFWLLRVLIGAWIGLVFIYFGFLIAQYNILKRLRPIHICIIVAGSLLSATYNGFIGVGALQLQNATLFFVNAIGISIGILGYCDFLEKKAKMHEILKTFGENTIIVVCTNNLIIEIVRLLDYKITGDILLRMGLFGTLLFAIFLAFIEWLIIKMSTGRLAVLFGKDNKIR